MRVVCTEYEDELYQELFMWAVFFNRIPLANFFLTRCLNPIGSALVASKLCKSLAKKANSPAMQCLAAELKANARFVVHVASAMVLSSALRWLRHRRRRRHFVHADSLSPQTRCL